MMLILRSIWIKNVDQLFSLAIQLIVAHRSSQYM